MKYVTYKLTLPLDGGDANTAAVRLLQLHGYSFIAKWGASAGRSGNLFLEASNNAYMREASGPSSQDLQEVIDNNLENPNATWEKIPGSDKAVDATADQHVWNVEAAFYNTVRLVWEETTPGAASPDNADTVFHGQGYAP